MSAEQTGTPWRTLREMMAEAERSPAFARLLRDWSMKGDVAHADQVCAAARETEHLMRAGAEAAEWHAGGIGLDEVPEWVGNGMLAALARWTSHRARLCSHKPSALRPQPVLAAAWKPNFVVCLKCAHRTEPEPGSVEHYRCDGCGNVGDEQVNGHVLSLGPFLYEVGVCETCDYGTRGEAE